MNLGSQVIASSNPPYVGMVSRKDYKEAKGWDGNEEGSDDALEEKGVEFSQSGKERGKKTHPLFDSRLE
ncbi:hypothetical protein ACFX13_003883 [Malus domestica]